MRKGSVAIQQSQQDVKVDLSVTEREGLKSMMEAGDDGALDRGDNF